MSAFIPAEWQHQQRLYCAWPSHPDLWPGRLLQEAREQIAVMINAICESQNFRVLVSGEEAEYSARKLLSEAAEIVQAHFGDIWLRDTGPIFDGRGHALRFAHNGWGGKYIYAGDETVGDELARLSEAEIRRFAPVLEGGALDHNGAGLILTTRQCLLNPNRNGWSEAQAEAFLRETFAARDVVWLDEGLLLDHTDGHVDNLARFVSADTVLCQQANGRDDPNAAIYARTVQQLEMARLNVVTVPSPGLVRDHSRAVMPASHMNFIIANEAVVVPTYGDARAAEITTAVLQELFPQRHIVAADARAVLTGGGSFHCITQQEPAHV